MTPERMAEIHRAAFQTQRPWTEEEFRELLCSPLVFETHKGVNCFALGRTIAGETELLTIATHPQAQRQGKARACLNNFILACGTKGSDSVFLEVDDQNAAAIALYKSFGFQETGRRKAYYRHPNGSRSDALTMALKIPT